MNLSESDVKELVQEILANAERLGLTWSLRAGVVTGFVEPDLFVRLDGDAIPIPTTPLIAGTGSLRDAGERVYVIIAPPAGVYSFPTKKYTYRVATARIDIATGNFTAETIVDALTLTVPEGEYELSWKTYVVGTNNGDQCAALMKDTNLAGTLRSDHTFTIAAAGRAQHIILTWDGVLAAGKYTWVGSMVRLAGPGTIQRYADAFRTSVFSLDRVG